MTTDPIASLVMSRMRPVATSNIRPAWLLPDVELVGRTLPQAETGALPASVAGIFEVCACEAAANHFEVNFQTQRALEATFGLYPTDRARMADEYADEEASAEVPVLNAADFTPDAVAARISDFALSRFGTGVGNGTTEDTDESRQAYADYVSPAIEQGFAAARAILGDVSEPVSQGIDATWSKVQANLGQFVGGGAPVE